MSQANPTFEEVVELYRQFRSERDWNSVDARSLAICLSLESNELLEHFQWSDRPFGTADELGDELADILLYALHFADCYDIDIPTAMKRKMEKAAKKYPASDFHGKTTHDQRAAWRAAKQRHIKNESL